MTYITLCCSAGMSTSLLVQKMQKEAESRGVEADIIAIPEGELDSRLSVSNVILIGPQIKFKKDEIIDRVAKSGKAIPFDVIPMIDYGRMDGAKVLDMAFNLINGK